MFLNVTVIGGNQVCVMVVIEINLLTFFFLRVRLLNINRNNMEEPGLLNNMEEPD